MKRHRQYALLVVSIALLTAACGSRDKEERPVVPVHNEWTWMSGANTIGQAGAYGIKGISAETSVPGARFSGVSWIDTSGNFWLFGGTGYDSAGAGGDLNDLWKFDGITWTWVSGADTINQSGAYGTKGAPADTNVPGARKSAVSWIDTSGNFWLFGGLGFDSAGAGGDLNDLWKFDGNSWTWVGGANTINQAGDYGTKGTPADTNVPGAREAAVSWIDRSGKFWLFGGAGYDSTGAGDLLNDLWKFDGNNWTWVNGANTIGQAGAYGIKGTPADTNAPGPRFGAVSWIDESGNLWLFGGAGYDSAGAGGDLNDLWKFDGNNWTWVSGADTINQTGAYGTKGVPSDANIPGARETAVSWIDASGNLWLFGGYGYDSVGAIGDLNDLWKFDGSNWTWVNGADIAYQVGIYGAKNTTADIHVPGARNAAISWADTSGNLWLFGGYGYDSAGAYDLLNDLWGYQP